MAQDGKDSQVASRRVVLVGPDAWSMIHLRDGLIRALVSRRHRVTCVVPNPSEADVAALGKLGAASVGWSPRSGPLDMVAHRRSIDALTHVLEECRPYAVMGYGLPTMLLASVAGRRAGAERVVPLVSSLAGLAAAPSGIGWSLKWLARSAFRAADSVVCHNEEDARRLVDARLMPLTKPVTIVPGGGVDLARFAAAPLPPLDNGLVFAMIARLDRAKGVLEFCEAARRIRERSDKVRFVLAGPPLPGPGGLTAGDAAAASSGAVELLGDVADVRDVLGAAHVLVLPSRVEGMPRTVLEALATGRPVIVSDIPGARETVDERVNGVLVPPGDVEALVAAMKSFLKRPDLIASMARASRLKAERRFGDGAVHETLIGLLVPAMAKGNVA